MRVVAILFSVLLLVGSAFAQSTEFVYQGSLRDGVNPANGSYDFEFRLFDAVSGGAQVGPLLSRSNVAVSGGIFSVSLDFGTVFPGADRFLELRTKNTGASSFTLLTPRQKLASAPYSVKSLSAENALQLGGLAAGQYTLTTDPRLSDARNPLAGSSSYIQNQVGPVPQSGSNFVISGAGTANIFNAVTQFNLNGNRLLKIGGTALVPNSNTFLGINAGNDSVTSPANTFVGGFAGASYVPGANPNGSNSFFGFRAGTANITGTSNSIFGSSAGSSLTSSSNSIFGTSAGEDTTTGSENSFFGSLAGSNNTIGSNNTFFGRLTGISHTTGNNVTLIGSRANSAVTDLVNATALGANALVNCDNCLVLGSVSGANNATATSNVGIGTISPIGRFDVRGDVYVGLADLTDAPAGSNRIFVANDIGDTNNSFRIDGTSDDLNIVARSGAGSVVGTRILLKTAAAAGGESTRMIINSTGTIAVTTLGAAGATPICRNASLEISTCSSSLRFKTNIARFYGSLDLVKRLKPITFDWKADGMHDIGLGAEDVAAVEPLLVTRNDKGDIEGVKYDRIGVVLVNAVKEQQAQIESQQKEIESQRSAIEQQRSELETMKAHICQQTPSAAFCLGKDKK